MSGSRWRGSPTGRSPASSASPRAPYNAILRQDPQESDARVFRGWVYLERGEVDRAIQDFREVLRQDPRDFETLRAIGIAQALSGRKADLQQTIQELKRVNPGRARLLQQLLKASRPSR